VTVPPAFQHQVILASAGSGKTWQLATRFLGLCAAGVAPGTILASTFTRAAAGEIRTRILSRAVAAVESEAERAAISKAAGRPIDREAALDLLERLGRAAHTLQIRTLDSVLSGIAAAFALELGIPPGTTIADEAVDQAMRREATRRLLGRGHAERTVSLLRQFTAGQHESSIGRAIDDAVTRLHDLWCEASDEAWDSIEPPRGTLPENEVAALVAAIERMTPSLRLPSHRKAASEVMAKFTLGDTAGVLASKLVSCADRDGKYRGAVVEDALLMLLVELKEHVIAVERAGIIEQTLATRDLIALWSEEYEAVKRERRLMTFADLPRRLSAAEGLGSLVEIGYRLDATLHHMLLDEMQDTSIAQWAALRPFAEELYAQEPGERSFFCVGDLKQSIYGWRGGASEILARLPGRIGIAPLDLVETRRCGPEIVACVNRTFTTIIDNPALSACDSAARQFAADFEPHRSHVPGASFVELREVEVKPEGDRREARIEEAVRLVAELHAEAPAATIGVLVRENRTVNRLLSKLGPGGRKLRAAGRGGAELIDAPPVEVVLSALRFAVHPGDTRSAFHVATSPLGPHVGVSVAAVLAARRDRGDLELGRLAGEIRGAIVRRGLVDVIRGWVEALAHSCEPRERRRLAQLLELSARLATDSVGEVDLESMIRAVETTRIADEATVPIQVMTVHQSKGLEFDLVILPELDRTLVRNGGELAAFVRAEPDAPATSVIRWVKAERREALPSVSAAVFEAHRQRQYREAFCILYVALTRAKRGLWILVDAPGGRSQGATFASVVRHANCPPDAAQAPGVWRYGNRDAALEAVRAGPLEGGDHLPDDPPSSRIELAATSEALRAMRSARSRAPSEVGEVGDVREVGDGGKVGEGTPLIGPFQGDPDRQRDLLDRGVAIHALFESVEWIELAARIGGGETPRRDALEALLRSALPARRIAPSGDAWLDETLTLFERAVELPAIRAILSKASWLTRHRSDAAAKWAGGSDARALESATHASSVVLEVHRELGFLRLTDRGVQQGSIDRLVVARHHGRAIAAEIIDYKTGGRNVDLGERSAHYAAQLAAYRAAVAEQFDLKPEAIVTRLVFVERGEVVVGG